MAGTETGAGVSCCPRRAEDSRAVATLSRAVQSCETLLNAHFIWFILCSVLLLLSLVHLFNYVNGPFTQTKKNIFTTINS